MAEQSDRTGIGRLVVSVTSGNGTLPIENAQVYIREYKDNSPLLYSLRTDSSGMTVSVTLPTPPRIDSLSPNGKVPYSEYVTTVRKDGFYTTENIGVPMFDGITSVQKVDLLPLTEEDLMSGETPEREYFENNGYTSLRGVGTSADLRGEVL